MFKLFVTTLVLTFWGNANDCLIIKDSLDREYCFKKKLQLEQRKYEGIISQNKDGLSKKQKEDTLLLLDKEIKKNTEEAQFLTEKKSILASYKAKIAALKIKAISKKKTKKKNTIKDSLKKLGIKL